MGFSALGSFLELLDHLGVDLCLPPPGIEDYETFGEFLREFEVSRPDAGVKIVVLLLQAIATFSHPGQSGGRVQVEIEHEVGH